MILDISKSGTVGLMSNNILEEKIKKEINRIHSEQIINMLGSNYYVFTTAPEIKDGNLSFETLKNNSLTVLEELIKYNNLNGDIYTRGLDGINKIKEY